ncbi:MAG TPA: hypothetical protein ENK99_01275 [Campylobacterales bacterium]|nr:hypothetical protein [Campylobacterales bacterium]
MNNTPIPISPVEQNIIELKVEGMSNTLIAQKLGINPQTVSYITRKPHIATIISETIKQSYETTKAYRVNLLTKIIESKLAKIEEDEDMSSLTRKDIVDLITTLDNMLKEEERASLSKDNERINSILTEITSDE